MSCRRVDVDQNVSPKHIWQETSRFRALIVTRKKFGVTDGKGPFVCLWRDEATFAEGVSKRQASLGWNQGRGGGHHSLTSRKETRMGTHIAHILRTPTDTAVATMRP